MSDNKLFEDEKAKFLDALKRISNGELHVRSRIIHEGAHSYSISGEELEHYERWEQDIKYKNECLEKRNKELREENAELKKKLENNQTVFQDGDGSWDYYPKENTKRRFTFAEIKRWFLVW